MIVSPLIPWQLSHSLYKIYNQNFVQIPFNNLIQTGDLFGKTNAGKDKRVINDVGNAGKNRLYRSNIFIPIAGNGVMGAAIYGPQYAPYTRYMNITGQEIKQLLKDIQSNMLEKSRKMRDSKIKWADTLEEIANAVEVMFGVKVAAVNVNVCGIIRQ